MPKLRKEETADINVQELDDAEYSDEEYESYDGEIPPAGTELTGYLKSMWWCRTAEKDDGSGLDPMLKALWIAADNEDDLEQYNGLPVIENAVLIPSAKFRWAGFLRAFGITMKAIKTSIYLISEDLDQRWNGAPIERIGTFRPGEDQDGAWSRVVTERHFYNEEWSARAKKWLPWEDEEEPEDVTDEADEDEADDEEYDEEYEEGEEEEDEEPEDEEPEEPPARTRRTAPARASRSAPAASRTASRAPAARSTRTASGKAPTARTRAASPRSTAKAGAGTKPAGRTRGRKASTGQDEPPF